MKKNVYKVMIRCFTYNQSAFILDALYGFTNQKTNFPFLIAIVDDASTDGEQNVIQNYISENFNAGTDLLNYSKDTEYAKITYAQHKKNLNCYVVFLALKNNNFKNPDGDKRIEYLKEWTEKSEYIAFCEGDDYWTDEFKLQTQVNFLDSHQEYTACFHNAMIKWEGLDRPNEMMCDFQTGDFNTTQIFEKWQLPLASLLVRKEVELSNCYKKLIAEFNGGFCFFIAASIIGKVYGFSNCWSIYRKNRGGITNSMSYSYCCFLDVGYALASGDHAALDVVLKKRNFASILYAYIMGDFHAKKVLSLVKKNRPFFLAKEFVRFALIWLPSKVLKKMMTFINRVLNRKLLLFVLFIIILVCFNQFFPFVLKKFYERTFSPFSQTDTNSFENVLRDNVYDIINTESWSKHPLAGAGSFIDKIREVSVWEYGEYGLLLHYAFSYAKIKNDAELIGLIKMKFDKALENGLQVNRSDQIAYGNVALDLFNMYQDEKYRIFVMKLSQMVKDAVLRDGLFLYREGVNEQHVDVIGLVVPFLVNYSKAFKDSTIYQVAYGMVNDYVKFGVDYLTGVPAQSYDLMSHVKLNHANWGRGISWFLLGTQEIELENIDEKNRLELLDSVLLSNKKLLYNHYFMQGDEVDMSATIPVLFHMVLKGKIDLSKDEYVNLIAKYFDSDGVLGYCSKSISFPHDKVEKTTSSLWCFGLSLYMLSLLE